MKTYLNDSSHTSLVEKLGKLHRQWRVIVDTELEPLGLTHPRWSAIWKLWRMGDNISQKQLADALEIELASLMRTLSQLEEQGLVQRHTCKDDKRVRIVNLTEAGIAVIRQMETEILQVRTELLAGITLEELTIFDSIIERISLNIHSKLDEVHKHTETLTN